jgi:hypothetical protein
MGDALTNAAASGLNVARKLKRLTGSLFLLDHVADGSTGDYRTIAEVRSGFLISSTSDGIALQVCESREATPELLGQMVAIAFDEKVFKIRGTDKLKPMGAPLKWVVALTPTGEVYR